MTNSTIVWDLPQFSSIPHPAGHTGPAFHVFW
jgi:hypothetical protein